MDTGLGAAFKWIQETFDFIKSFLPHYAIIKPTEAAVKFVKGKPKLCTFDGEGGIIWWWPLVTELITAPVVTQPLELEEQAMTTLKTPTENTVDFIIDSCVIYSIFDLEAALVNVHDYDEQLKVLVQGEIRRLLWGKDWSAVHAAINTLGDVIKRNLNPQIEDFGIEIEDIKIQSSSKTKVLTLRGSREHYIPAVAEEE